MTNSKQLVVDMPQMAIGALSESWLLKELGDFHWASLCKGLGKKSKELINDTDDRLYATFVRIRYTIDKNLSSFKENDDLELNSEISRFGNSMYFSNMSLKSDGAVVNSNLMTTFTLRSKDDNTKLAKSEPDVEENTIPKELSFPSFGAEYRQLRKDILKEFIFDGRTFDVPDLDVNIFESSYDLIPYHDLNGVGLLYFAAYPIINDICTNKYFNAHRSENWAMDYFTEFKDIHYFGNCNSDDKIKFVMHELKSLSDQQILISSSLFRASDNELIARLFTVKSRAVS